MNEKYNIGRICEQKIGENYIGIYHEISEEFEAKISD